MVESRPDKYLIGGQENVKVIITDCDHDNVMIEENIIKKAGMEFQLCKAKTEDEVIRDCQDADALIIQYAKITDKVMEHCPKLRFVVRYGVGVDTIDLEAATRRGIQVGNVPDYGMNEVADHAIALSLTMLRKIGMMNRYTKTRAWNYQSSIPIHRFNALTVGVIGLGRIGRNFAQKMHALGFQVIGLDPFFKEDEESKRYVKQTTLEEVLEKSDLISIHCPAEGNQNLFGMQAFQKMKRNAILVNVARGGIINEKELKTALDSHLIGGAAVDCMLGEPVDKSNPLFGIENFLVTPHMAWYSEEAAKELKRKVAEEAVRFLKGEPIHYPVNKINGGITA